MNKVHLLSIAMLGASMTSCIKDEPLGQECDIQAAYVELSDYSAVFYNETDTHAPIAGDYSSSNIVFTNVHLNADLTHLAPKFDITPGATISPASGTELDFSKGAQEYVVTSEDGAYKRTYKVSFVTPKSFTEFDFEDYYKVRFGDDTYGIDYYVWSDNGNTENPNWGSANGPFAMLAMGDPSMEFPTTPDENGHDGACVKLTTRSTGMLGAMFGKPLAAGNFFLGTFDMENAVMNPLGSTHFGQPFAKEPLRFTGFYKYVPGEQMQDAKQQNMDGTDEGSITAILYKNHDADGNSVWLDGNNVNTSDLVVARAALPQVSTELEFVIMVIAVPV